MPTAQLLIGAVANRPTVPTGSLTDDVRKCSSDAGLVFMDVLCRVYPINSIG